MKTQILAIVIASQIINSCSNSVNEPNENTLVLSDTLTLSYKQVYSNAENGLSIKFDSVLSDSRCPVDVICVWEGDAELKFTFSDKDGKVEFILHTARNYFNTDTLLLGYQIELLDVYPYPHSQREIKAEDYKAKMMISKVRED